MEASSSDGQCGPNSFAAQWYWAMLAYLHPERILHILLRPLRITVSNVAITSVMTASASYRPARTEMMSELGFVYFLVRAASRKTVNVCAMSNEHYSTLSENLTSSAISSDGGVACLTHSRAWRKSCCDCACRCNISSGAMGPTMRFSPAASGRCRKNSFQKPSERSTSSSSSLERCEYVAGARCGHHTLNKVSYKRMILGWKASGFESCVNGDGSMISLALGAKPQRS